MKIYPKAKESTDENIQHSKSDELINSSMNRNKSMKDIFKINFSTFFKNESEIKLDKKIRVSSAKNLRYLDKNKKEKLKEEEKREGENKNKANEKYNEFALQNLDKINYYDDGYENLKKEFELTKINLYNKERDNNSLKEQIKIYQNEINSNNNEINGLKNTLKDKENFIKELNKMMEEQAKNYQNLLQLKEQEIKKFKEKIEHLEYKCQTITNEKYSINSENTKLKFEINGMKFKNEELEKSLGVEKNKNKIFFNQIEKKEDEIQILMNKLKIIAEFASNPEKINKSDISLTTPSSKSKKKEEEEKISNDTPISNNFGKIGIKNELLNCYMSSVLQILKNIKNFSLKLIEIKTDDNIIESLKKIITDLLYSKKQKVSLYEFKRYFGNVYKRFEGRKDNDSTYFLLYLIQHIHKNLNKSENQKKTNIINYFNLDLNNFEKAEFEKYINKNEAKNNSFIYDLFYGYIMNKLFCTGCNNCNITFQSYNILDIPIMNENKKLNSLDECLNCYLITKDQKDIKGFECSSCKKKLLSLVTCILKLPKILIINLKRVGERYIYNHEIEIPFILKTKDIEKLKKFNQNYELIGFVKHFGTDKSGHNIAYSKNLLDDKWCMYNDEKVEEINEYPSTEKSFLLFYQLIEKVENENSTPY